MEERLFFDDFQIERFRGLRDLRLTDMRRVNLLVGANNTGKTTVLEAMHMCAAPHDIQLWFNVGGTRSDEPTSWVRTLKLFFPIVGRQLARMSHDGEREPMSSEIAARGHGAHGTIGFTATWSPLLTAMDSGAGPAYPVPGFRLAVKLEHPARVELKSLLRAGEPGRNPIIVANESLSEFTYTFGDSRGFQLEPLESSAIPIHRLAAHAFDDRFHPTQRFSKARVEGLAPMLIEISQEVDPRIIGIEVLELDYKAELFLTLSDGSLLPLSAFGHGVRQALGIALMVVNARSGVLLIDEVEAGIHSSALPSLFRMLVALALRLDVQLVLSTHSLETVDALLTVDPTFDEDLALYRLLLVGDAVQVQRVGEDDLRRVRGERGFDIR